MMMIGKDDRVEEAEEGYGWSELTRELLGLIDQRLIKLKHKIRIRAVCKRWRKTLAELQPVMFRQSSSSPLLILPYCNNNNNEGEDAAACSCSSQEEGCQCRIFLDVAHNQFHHIDFAQGFQKTNCRGSAFGWLFMLPLPIPVLLNPLTGEQISLPSITSFPDVLEYNQELVGLEYLLHHAPDGDKVRVGKRRLAPSFMSRIAMSTADPTSGDCIVMAICQNGYSNLAFCKPGGDDWRLIPNPPDSKWFQNVVFWRNQLYAVDIFSRVLRCDLSNPEVPTMSFFVDGVAILNQAAYLLVGPADELMMITKSVDYGDEDIVSDDHGLPVHDHDHDHEEEGIEHHDAEVDHDPDEVGDDDDDDERASVACISDIDTDREEEENDTENYWSTDFRVYKLNEDTCQWDMVQSIGDYALFVGTNTPTYLSTKEYPGLKSNCIYFTDDEFNVHVRGRFGGHDMGIYHLDDGTTESFCCTKLYKPRLIWPQPVWIFPSNQ